MRLSTPRWEIRRVIDTPGLDEVLIVDEASFINPWTRAMFDGELARPEMSYIYLARADSGHAVGYCAVWLVRDAVHINNLAVRPEWRRQGAARALLAHALGAGARQGARHATLEVRRSNAPARQLYERAGFAETGVGRSYYIGADEDAIILWCTLETEHRV